MTVVFAACKTKNHHRISTMSFKHFVSIVAIAFAAASASTAQAHAKLESSEPKAGSTVDGAPKVVRLAFNEALEPAFSKVTVADSANAAVAIKNVEVDKTNPRILSAKLPQLRSGQYQVRWSTVTHDGHKTKGDFTFNVK
jgi:methionine-rich copper-binding protein CopC